MGVEVNAIEWLNQLTTIAIRVRIYALLAVDAILQQPSTNAELGSLLSLNGSVENDVTLLSVVCRSYCDTALYINASLSVVDAVLERCESSITKCRFVEVCVYAWVAIYTHCIVQCLSLAQVARVRLVEEVSSCNNNLVTINLVGQNLVKCIHHKWAVTATSTSELGEQVTTYEVCLRRVVVLRSSWCRRRSCDNVHSYGVRKNGAVASLELERTLLS